MVCEKSQGPSNLEQSVVPVCVHGPPFVREGRERLIASGR